MMVKDGVFTIRKWLFLLVVAVVMPTVMTTAALVYQAYDRERVSGERTRIETARALMQAVDRELSSAQGMLQALVTSPYLTSGDMATFYAQATEALQYRPNNNFVLSDASGQQLINTLRPFNAVLPRHGNPDQLRRVFETGRPVVSDLYLGGVTHHPIISIDMPVVRNNRVIYDLSMGFFPQRLGDILRLQRLPMDWVVSIFDSRGIVVARTRGYERFVGHRGAPELVQRMAEVAEDSIKVVTLEGIPVVSAFSRSAISNWTVAIGVPRADIAKELWTSIAWIIGAAALSLLIGLMLAKIVADRIARSIYALATPAMALGYGAPVAIPPLDLKEANDVAQALVKASQLLRERTVERDLAEKAEQELRIAQQQLEHSEAFQRRIFEKAPDAILLVAQSGRIIRANMEAEAIFGYTNKQLLALSIEDLMPNEFRQHHQAIRASYFSDPVQQMGRGKRFLGLRSNGTEFPVDVMLNQLQSTEGSLVIATVRDITELRRSEERINAALREKETLLKELYHRVKNNLQVIASMINLQERAIPDNAARIALKDAANRVRAMALVHEKLYRSSNLSSIALDNYVAQLCKQLGKAVAADQRGIVLITEAEPIEIGLDIAIPLGLVLNELISNSLKHAFPAGRRGQIRVRLEKEDDITMRLMVSDDGIGLPPGMTPTFTPSLGLKLVAALAAQLDGKFSLETRQGTVASLTFPLIKQDNT